VNSDFEIYRGSEDLIPNEDKVRLEGYLQGRADAVALEKYKKEFEEKMNELNVK
jgi:hypothetical protein